jgi:hypothetical protein
MKKAYIVIILLLVIALFLGYYLYAFSTINTSSQNIATEEVVKEVIVDEPFENVINSAPASNSVNPSSNSGGEQDLLKESSIEDLEAILDGLDDLDGVEESFE